MCHGRGPVQANSSSRESKQLRERVRALEESQETSRSEFFHSFFHIYPASIMLNQSETKYCGLWFFHRFIPYLTIYHCLRLGIIFSILDLFHGFLFGLPVFSLSPSFHLSHWSQSNLRKYIWSCHHSAKIHPCLPISYRINFKHMLYVVNIFTYVVWTLLFNSHAL